MKIWIGGELESDIYNDFRISRSEIESQLELIQERSYGEGVTTWILIPIILVGQSNVATEGQGASFPEFCKYHGKERMPEFRPAIDHSSFKEADAQTKVKMLAQALLQSIVKAKELNIPNFDLARFESDLQDFARHQGWIE